MKAIAQGESFQGQEGDRLPHEPQRRRLHAALSGEPGKLITAATQGPSSHSWPTAACEGAKP